MADNSKQSYTQKITAGKKAKAERDQKIWEEHDAFCEDETNWQTVEIPSTDLFDKPFGSISLNLINYGPGRHFVRPDVANQLVEILANRYQADMRILRPTPDKKMLAVMARNGQPVTLAGTTAGDMQVVGPIVKPYHTAASSPYPTSGI
jgi:hypothetical protein